MTIPVFQKIAWLAASRGRVALVFLAFSTAAFGQNLFAPAAYVNDATITHYEVDQRVQLLKSLRTVGDLREISLERLINEQLQLQAATLAGISVSDDDIVAGVAEFATRFDLSGEQLLANLQTEGVAPESFRDFIRVGSVWRQLVRSKFRSAGNITDAEIDSAISLAGTRGSARVLISEIFLPMNTPSSQAASLELAPQISRLTSVADFSGVARQYSVGPSRDRGGVVEQWVPLENLPPQIREVLLSMKPGQVTEAIEIPNALALFQLRAIQETVAPVNHNPVLDYAAYYIADARPGSAALLRARVDVCDDLYGVAEGQPENVLDRVKLPVAQIPADFALELARLDTGEVSTALRRASDNALVFLMLCGRNLTADTEVSRDQVRQSLSNSRLSGLANAYLGELRANATIRLP